MSVRINYKDEKIEKNEKNEKNEVSFSMMVDKDERHEKRKKLKHEKKEKQELQVRPRNVQVWVPDDAVTECSGCGVSFGFLTRRHHCRSCGRIFCHLCSAKKTVLPRDIVRFPLPFHHDSSPDLVKTKSKNVSAKEKVCDPCYGQLKRMKNIYNVTRVFEIIGFTLPELRNLSGVCKQWCEASMVSLSSFREIQYRLPSFEFNQREKKLLQINASFVRNHSAWFLPMQQALPHHVFLDFPFMYKNCRKVMCSRFCRPGISFDDLVYVMLFSITATEHYECLSQITEDEMEFWLPHLTYLLRTHVCIKNLLLQSKKHKEKIFWLCHLWREEARRKVFQNIEKLYMGIIEDLKVDESMKRGYLVAKSMLGNDTEAMKETTKKGSFSLPFGTFSTINFGECEVKTSSTRPIVFPCYDSLGVSKKVMVKTEDIRKDLIIMNVIKYMVKILQKENYDMGVVTYDVMPLSKSGGIIDIIKNASTLYDIQYNEGKNVFRYIVEYNSAEPFDVIRNRFVKSTAAYCVITYLLGIGDRHLDNIMITKDGRLFHIDFGFILGDDPKPITTPMMRLSVGMIEAIGEINSESYNQFEELCSDIYNILRRHVRPIYTLLSLLVPLKIITKERLDSEILKKFSPGENIVRAEMHFSKLIEGSRTSYSQSFIDMSHHGGKLVSQTSSIVSTPFKKLFSSFESWYWSTNSNNGVLGTSPP